MEKNSIKRLYLTLPRGRPFDSSALKRLQISPALASRYVASGWLVRLGRGVFMFPNDDLKLEPCLSFLALRIPGLHVGGKTALAWRGIRHNVGTKERTHLWGAKSTPLPSWFTDRFAVRYVARNLLDEKLSYDFALEALPEDANGPLVSVPERALLELLSDVGITQGVEEARNIMESMRSVRPDVLQTLLRHCPRIKVVRLCVQWADELGLPWAAPVRETVGKRGRSRWSARLPDGTTLILKP